MSNTINDYPRTDFVAVGDETGVLFATDSFTSLKDWARTSQRAESFLKRDKHLFLYKRIRYGVKDPNSRPIPNMEKCDHILLSTLHYTPAKYEFSDTPKAATAC